MELTTEEDWDPETKDYEVFKHVRKSYADYVSEVQVEDLLLVNKDLLALFYVVSTWDGVKWYKFSNMNNLVPGSKEYWHQCDMNRVAHSYASQVDNLGSHFGDCTSFACTCSRCLTESNYLEMMHLRNKTDISTIELIAMLLARDKIRIAHDEGFDRELHAGDLINNFAECYRAARAKFPGEYSINLKRHTEYWTSLSIEERQPYFARAQQIRDWCDQLPVCPGVPWW